MNCNILLVIVIAALGYGLISLNGGMARNAPPEHDDDAPKPAATDTTKTPPPTQPSTPGQVSAVPPDEIVVGDPSKAKYKVVAGWSYNAANQSDSSKLSSTLQSLQEMAQKSNGQVSVQIVDVDVPDETRSTATRGIHDLGISVNGKPATGDNLGEGDSNPSAVTQGIGTMVQH